MVEKSWAVQIQRLPCCSFWPQDRGPEVVLAGFYLLVQIQTVILKERMLWVTPARLWGIQRSSSNLFFPYSCCCFLFSYLCMWPLLQLNIFFWGLEQKPRFSVLGLLGRPRLFMRNIPFPICEHTTPHGRWIKPSPKVLIMSIERKSYKETHNFCQ